MFCYCDIFWSYSFDFYINPSIFIVYTRTEVVSKIFVHSMAVVLLLVIYFLLWLILWGFCVCSLFCYAILCVLSNLAIILMEKRELVALLQLSS